MTHKPIVGDEVHQLSEEMGMHAEVKRGSCEL
jgi:hypothetical protein